MGRSEQSSANLAPPRLWLLLLLPPAQPHPPPPPLPPSSRPDTYLGHQMERGYNAIALNSCYNCWVRRVRVVDADNAVLLVGTDFTTVSDVYVGVTALRGVHKSKVKGLGGHHALNVANGQNNLLTRCGSRGGGAPPPPQGPSPGGAQKSTHACDHAHAWAVPIDVAAAR